MDEDQVEKVQDFEEECMEDLAREKDYKKNTSNEERIHRTAERFILLNDISRFRFISFSPQYCLKLYF